MTSTENAMNIIVVVIPVISTVAVLMVIVAFTVFYYTHKRLCHSNIQGIANTITDELQCVNNASYGHGRLGLFRETELDHKGSCGSKDPLSSVSSEYYVNEELYWSPALHEDDIKEQLKKLKVKNLFKDNVK